jgi:hypothetical protein
MINNTITSIKNIFRWIPIIWNDKDWDYYFLYKILYTKLLSMEKHLRKYGHSANSKKDADRIKTCINILKQLMKDEYHEKVFKPFYKKWGKPEFNWIDVKDKPNYTELKITNPNVITKEDEEQEGKEFKDFIQIENDLKQRDINI